VDNDALPERRIAKQCRFPMCDNAALKPVLYNSGMSEAHLRGRARPKPFMEHPTGQFATAVEAMTDAIQRLRALPDWNNWITFCAQGAGQHENSYHPGEIRMRRGLIDTGAPIDIESVSKSAQTQTSSILGQDGVYQLFGTTPVEAARILDSIFRNHLGIHPHADEGNDYAIGAEW